MHSCTSFCNAQSSHNSNTWHSLSFENYSDFCSWTFYSLIFQGCSFYYVHFLYLNFFWSIFLLTSYIKQKVHASSHTLWQISLLRIKSQISSNFNLFLLDELFIIMTVAFLLSSKDDKSINVLTSSSNAMPTKLDWVVTIWSLFIWWVVYVPLHLEFEQSSTQVNFV